MTDDIHAAVERWKRQLYDGYPPAKRYVCSVKLHDSAALAAAYLALLDDAPITEEWLITQEGVTHDDDWISIWGVASDDEMKYPVFIWERAEFQQMSGPVLKSRGAVRALLLAMGVSNGEK